MLTRLIHHARMHGTPGEFILERARACGVEPYLMREVNDGRITARDLDLPDLDVRLATFKATQTARLMLWKKSLQDVLKILEMPVIVLKGAPLGQKLTGDPLWRETTDIDLWIDPSQRERATSLLKSIGYEIGEEPRLWATNQIILTHPTRIPIELHWNLAPPPWKTPNFSQAFESSQTSNELGFTIHVLNDAMQYLHIMVHAHQHYFALKSVMDYHFACQNIKRDIALIDEYGLSRLENFLNLICENEKFHPNRKFTHTCVHLWYNNILSSQARGELVFGRESKWQAAMGVLVRALSMGLMDGIAYPVEGFLRVIFAGPHRIGMFNIRHFGKFIEKI